VLSFIGTYVAMKGADSLPALIRKTEPKPIRIFMQDGRNDQRALAQDGTYAENRDWFFQNVRLMKALTDKGYDVNYTWSMGNHGLKQGGGLLPDMLRWLWRDQPVSTDPRNNEERSFHEPPSKAARN